MVAVEKSLIIERGCCSSGVSPISHVQIAFLQLGPDLEELGVTEGTTHRDVLREGHEDAPDG